MNPMFRNIPTDIVYGSTHVFSFKTAWLTARQPCEVCKREWLDLSMYAGTERPLTTVGNQICKPRPPWPWERTTSSGGEGA